MIERAKICGKFLAQRHLTKRMLKANWQNMERIGSVFLVAALCGCGGGNATGGAPPGEVDFATTRALASIYSQYLATHGDRSPADEKSLRDFLATKQDVLTPAQLTVDKFFVSPRSDQPLIWVYGMATPSSTGLGRCLAYEKNAVDGKRLVIADGGRYEVMDDTKFRTLFPKAM
jgi:hypothetical protein